MFSLLRDEHRENDRERLCFWKDARTSSLRQHFLVLKGSLCVCVKLQYKGLVIKRGKVPAVSPVCCCGTTRTHAATAVPSLVYYNYRKLFLKLVLQGHNHLIAEYLSLCTAREYRSIAPKIDNAFYKLFSFVVQLRTVL